MMKLVPDSFSRTGQAEPRPLGKGLDAVRSQEVTFSVCMGMVAILSRGDSDIFTPATLWALAGLLAFNLGFHAVLRKHREFWVVPFISVAVNTLIVTAVVWASGGESSIFWPLYMLPIFTACMYLERRAVVFASLAAAGFMAYFYADPLYNGDPWGRTEFLFKTLVLGATAAAVASLALRHRAAQNDLEKSRLQLAEEMKKQTERLEGAKKPAAVKNMVDGVVHDYKNILSVVGGYSDVLLQSLDLADPRREDVIEIKKAVSMADDLARRLLAQSRGAEIEKRDLNLNTVIFEMGNMLRKLVGPGIELNTSLDLRLRPVQANPHQLGQVILNFAVNARDAMPDGGVITIETSNVRFSRPVAKGAGQLPSGAYVLLSVGDTGIGMDPATLSRIFERFFTTKGPGKGTGLGLATVLDIVRQFGGTVEAQSEPGKGTTFRVYLPVSEEGAAKVSESAPRRELDHARS